MSEPVKYIKNTYPDKLSPREDNIIQKQDKTLREPITTNIYNKERIDSEEAALSVNIRHGVFKKIIDFP